MSSAICFNLDQSKILLSGNGLTNEAQLIINVLDIEIDDYFNIPYTLA